MVKYDPNKALTPKKQDSFLNENLEIIKVFTDFWTPKYQGPIQDYRRMAAGKLPTLVEERMKKADPKNKKSQLIPNMIADHCATKTAALINDTINNPDNFHFVGTEDADAPNAPNAEMVVKHQFRETNFKARARLAVNDAVITGMGFLERRHYVKRLLKRKYGGYATITANDYDIVFVGPSWDYARTEMIYLDSRAREFDKIRGYVKYSEVPYSSIVKNSYRDGMYERYAKNIKNIKANDYDPDFQHKFDTSSDHDMEAALNTGRDFMVLIAEFWTSMINMDDLDVPAWHLTTIANPIANPQLLRFDMDPMGNGNHPLRMFKIFDYSEPRMAGWALPEQLVTLFLEQFYKTNQRINMTNMAVRRGGILMGPRSAFPAEFLAAEADKMAFTNGSAKDIQTLPVDLQAYQHLMNESMNLDLQAEKKAKTNPVSMGQFPGSRQTATTTATVDQRAKEATLDPVARVEETISQCALDNHEHTLFLVPEPYVGRVVGPGRSPVFFRFSRTDIAGHFDIICEGSSQITPKALRMANGVALFQQFAAAGVQFSKQKMGRTLLKLAEFPGAESIVAEESEEPQRIERENGMMSNGIPVQPLAFEDHQAHIYGHQAYITQLLQSGAHAKSPAVMMILMHIQMHIQLAAQSQGALDFAGGNGQEQLPTFGDQGDMLNDYNSDMSSRVGQNG